MLKNKLIMIFLLLSITLAAKSQSKEALHDFANFVSKRYRLPDELKYNCEWIYAVVKVKTNSGNKIVGYEFANEPPTVMKKSFNLLLGYRFPKTMKINGRTIVFYLSIDNAEACKPKDGEKRFYAPNDVVTALSGYLTNILQADPHAIIVPELIIQSFPPSQQ